MNHKKNLRKIISRCKNLEGKLDMLDTIICLTVDPEIVQACNDIIKELMDAEIWTLDEVV
jgi:hypothetical protein